MALSNKSEFTGITGRMPEIVHGVDYWPGLSPRERN
jgi:hypothetical protein